MMDELERKKNDLMAESHEIAQKGIFPKLIRTNFNIPNMITGITLTN